MGKPLAIVMPTTPWSGESLALGSLQGERHVPVAEPTVGDMAIDDRNRDRNSQKAKNDHPDG